jgi:hypothetical protein
VHHVVKRAQGGSDFELDQLVALCRHAQTDAPYARGRRLVMTPLGDGRFAVQLTDRPALARAMRLRPDQKITLAQTVGYPKKEEWLVPNHAVRSRVKTGMAGTTTLDHVLSGLAREGALLERLPGGRVRCYACGHRCLIPPGQRGICKLRGNEDGRLSANRS